MPKSDAGLLTAIEAAALDSTASVAEALRKCIALGGQAGSEELRDWARRELDGYKNEEDLPDYRALPAVVKIDGTTFNSLVTGQQLSSFDIPEFARERLTSDVQLRQGVSELEAISKSGPEIKLQHPLMPDLVAYMNSQQEPGGGRITSMYWTVSATAVHGTVDAVRTKLVAVVAEMRAAGATDRDVPPAAIAEQAVNVVIHGAKRSPIVVNTAQSAPGSSATASISGSPASSASRVPGWVRGPWGFSVGLGTLVAAYAGIAAGTGWPPF